MAAGTVRTDRTTRDRYDRPPMTATTARPAAATAHATAPPVGGTAQSTSATAWANCAAYSRA